MNAFKNLSIGGKIILAMTCLIVLEAGATGVVLWLVRDMQVHQAWSIILLTSIAAGACGLFFGFLVMRGISDSLANLIYLAKDVGYGNMHTSKTSMTGRSEIAQLTQALFQVQEFMQSITVALQDVAKGKLDITMPVKHSNDELSRTINTMVAQLSSFADEVTRVAREVGTQGKLGGQARVEGVSGTWRDLTQNVNLMADNLTAQVRNIAEVTTAVAQGDLSRTITIDAKGEVQQLKNTINTMVIQLRSFADEVTRVAREVGTDGILGGQARVKGVSGTWRDLTDTVNRMADNLTDQVRNIAEVTTAVAQGDLSRTITIDANGEVLELKDTVNIMVVQLRSFADEVTRVAREVGTEGKLGGQARVEGVSGTWRDLTDTVNRMADNLTNQVRSIAKVTMAVSRGELNRKVEIEAKGEMLELKTTINRMVVQLNRFASEVSRMAREVGTEGKLGGQANVEGVSGTWRDLTDDVNQMATNLTEQVRGIASIVTAVAHGNLRKKLTLTARGEIADLADTINNMIDTLSLFAEQVSDVAHDVGVKGVLGGQANVSGAQGTWRDLTDNVNQLAANLTTQVRAIGDVATAVTQGDLTRIIDVQASGEVADLKDNVNTMIRTLSKTTLINTEQDWLKTNLTHFTRILQGQRDLNTMAQTLLSELAPVVSAQHGLFYAPQNKNGEPVFKLISGYAFQERKHLANQYCLGEGLVGQCAQERQRILLTEVPEDYIRISSGLGEGVPLNIVVLPILFEDKVLAIVELASFSRFSEITLVFLEQLVESMSIMMNSLNASVRTKELLQKSQILTDELQSQQQELQLANNNLEKQTHKLEKQKKAVEEKNVQIETARVAIEEKAEELALASKYKSEFLTNMSHELRTPLNSLLILAQLLTDNTEKNLTDKQLDYARTISKSGSELLNLINDILDLSKVEAGAMQVEFRQIIISDICESLDLSMRQTAQKKNIGFDIRLSEEVPAALYTDQTRLLQILKNLLSNAIKFTAQGEVKLSIERALDGWSPLQEELNLAELVVAFSVSDTGIGIPESKQRIIFEAFQQVDGSISRRYGGTGLGLNIAREMANLLNGELRLTSSSPDEGSTFTLYLPQQKNSSAKLSQRKNSSAKLSKFSKAETEENFNKSPQLSKVAAEITDDRDNLQPGDTRLLIIEDDNAFANILLDMAHAKGFKGLIAAQGDHGMEMAQEYAPNAIILDIQLPVMDGWAVLQHLKHTPETRHIPVYIISVDAQRQKGFKQGAIGVLEKPVSTQQINVTMDELVGFQGSLKQLLIVEDNAIQQDSIVDLLQGKDVEITVAGTGQEALAQIKAQTFDCVVLDLKLTDMDGFTLLGKINENAKANKTAVIIYTGRDLTEEEETWLKLQARCIIVKGASAPNKLLEEAGLFLHRAIPETSGRTQREPSAPAGSESALEGENNIAVNDLPGRIPPAGSESALEGKKILLAEDDARNAFALVSLFERYGMQVSHAENGREAIEVLQQTPDIDIVMMDIMMPEMDGFEAMRLIRQDERFASLPIIAITAKAMQDDREKCLAAGASDYVSKPPNNTDLLETLRKWTF
ncbi:response regulator [Desulfococcaceae bacterium HSG9]|nr:response regulator [Desulfococcaceae bacterium HSG9]